MASTIDHLASSDDLCWIQWEGHWWSGLYFPSSKALTEAYAARLSNDASLRSALSHICLDQAIRGVAPVVQIVWKGRHIFVSVRDGVPFHREWLTHQDLIVPETERATIFPNATKRTAYQASFEHLYSLFSKDPEDTAAPGENLEDAEEQEAQTNAATEHEGVDADSHGAFPEADADSEEEDSQGGDDREDQHSTVDESPIQQRRSTKHSELTPERTTFEEYYKFRNLWKRLKAQGWKYVHHLLTDRYAPPNAPKNGGVDGVDWFSSSNALTEWCIEEDRKQGLTFMGESPERELARRLFSSVEKETPKRTPEDARASPRNKRARMSPASHPDPCVPQLHQRSSSGHWWKHMDIPDYEDIKHILAKLGYEADIFIVPADLDENLDADIEFTSSQGMGMFFAFCGIPGYDRRRLKKKEDELLQRWVRFINVPKRTKRELKKISFPSGDRLTKLLVSIKFQTAGDNRFYVPGADRMEGGRTCRTAGVHYFENTELNTSVRVHVRGFPFLMSSWLLQPDLMKECDEKIAEEALEMELAARRMGSYLEARLWGAASSQDLPQFTGLPNEYIMRALRRVDTETLGLETETVDECQEQQPSRAEAMILDPVEEIVRYPKDQNWYRKESLPSNVVIKPLLRKIGFEAASPIGEWVHAQTPLFRNMQELREFGAKYNLPGRDHLSDIESVALDRWLDFAHISGVNASNSICRCSGVSSLNEAQLVQTLVSKCRFQYFDSHFYPPGADEIRRGRASGPPIPCGESHRRSNLTLQELKRFIIASKKLELVEGASEGCTMTESDELRVRLFAATDPPPRSEFTWKTHTSVEVLEKRDVQSEQSETNAAQQDDGVANDLLVPAAEDSTRAVYASGEPVADEHMSLAVQDEDSSDEESSLDEESAHVVEASPPVEDEEFDDEILCTEGRTRVHSMILSDATDENAPSNSQNCAATQQVHETTSGTPPRRVTPPKAMASPSNHSKSCTIEGKVTSPGLFTQIEE